MQKPAVPVLRDVVLLGGGHSHVGVLRDFGLRPMPGVRLTVICTDPDTPYSGMLPGYVAGHYGFDAVHIDLGRLAVFAGARFICAEATGIDRASGQVIVRGRPPIAYDIVSINIGSTPQWNGVPGAERLAMPVKPIYRFNQRWLALLERVRAQPAGRNTIAVVGAGAGGIELTLAMHYRLGRELQALGRDPQELEFKLFGAHGHILPTHNAGVRRRFAAVLRERGIRVHLDAAVQEVQPGRLRIATGAWFAADEVIWVTQAGGAAWLRDTGLALDAAGCIRVNDCLQSITDPRVFAAGDIASIDVRPLEKNGVLAVRMGRPLARNLRLSLRDRPLRAYRPQRRWLALISTGDRKAVASHGALSFAGAWVWRWKDRIDRRFMCRFADLAPMHEGAVRPPARDRIALTLEESVQADASLAMRCGGCAAKVGASVLSRALATLLPLQRADVLLGLAARDDAAIVRVPPGKAMVHTVDFFRSFVDDPYLFGKVAANHALGDIFAMGAEPQTATAVVTVPPGLDSKVEQLLLQLMTGAVEVLDAAGCALVGGHSGEGQELALGFAVNGLIDGQLRGLMRKGGMRAGQVLILTKPLGTGILFAAHAQLAARGRWIEAALASMVLSSQRAAQCLRSFGASACTDVTGFGLLGHLVEMATPSAVEAQVNLASLPLLEGALACAAAGRLSSLHGSNVGTRHLVRNAEQIANDPRYPLLFDPQTAGGLLASVPAESADACVSALHGLGYVHAAVIGHILPYGDARAPISLTM